MNKKIITTGCLTVFGLLTLASVSPAQAQNNHMRVEDLNNSTPRGAEILVDIEGKSIADWEFAVGGEYPTDSENIPEPYRIQKDDGNFEVLIETREAEWGNRGDSQPSYGGINLTRF